MNLRGNLARTRDLFQKLERDAASLEQSVTSDKVFNFAVTAHSLNDWVKNDPHVPKSAKDDLNRHRRDTRLKACRDIANCLKHFELDKENAARAVVVDVSSQSGYGMGRYGKGKFGLGEESVTIALRRGGTFNVLALVSEVVELWRQFLQRHSV